MIGKGGAVGSQASGLEGKQNQLVAMVRLTQDEREPDDNDDDNGKNAARQTRLQAEIFAPITLHLHVRTVNNVELHNLELPLGVNHLECLHTLMEEAITLAGLLRLLRWRLCHPHLDLLRLDRIIGGWWYRAGVRHGDELFLVSSGRTEELFWSAPSLEELPRSSSQNEFRLVRKSIAHRFG